MSRRAGQDGWLLSPLGVGALTLACLAWFGPGWLPAAGFPALGLLWWRRHARPGLAGSPLDVPIAALGGMGLLALLPSVDPAASLGRLLGLALGICLFVAVFDVLSSEKRLWIVVSGLAVAGVALAAAGLVGTEWPIDSGLPAWLRAVYASLPRWITFLPRSQDGALNGNKLAAILAMLLPLPAAVMLYTPGRLLRLGWGFGAGLMVCTLLLTRSPSGLLAAAAALLALIAVRSRRGLVALPIVGLASLAAGVWAGARHLAEMWLGLSIAPGGSPMLDTRLALWSAALDLIRRFPIFGIGIGTFPQMLARYAPWLGADTGVEIPHAHNLYLQFALDLGIPGLLAFLVLLSGTLWLAFSAVRLGPTARARGLAAGATSGLVAYLVYGIGDAIGPGEKSGLFLWLLLGIIAASGSMAQRELRPGAVWRWDKALQPRTSTSRSPQQQADHLAPVDSVIYLSSFEWTYHTARPQQLARALAERVPVLYVETTGLRGAGPKDGRRLLRRLRRALAGRYRVLPNVWVFSPLTLPFHGPPLVRQLNRLLLRDAVRGQARDIGLMRPLLLTSLPTWASIDLVGHVGEVAAIYDCMDDVTAIPRVDVSVGSTEAQLALRVDVMVAASEELRRLKTPLRDDVVVVGQGVDPDHFAARTTCPPELALLPHPLLLFVGGVDERVDFELLDGIARLRPEWSIVLVGPELYVNTAQRVGAANVHCLGYRPYQLLPRYIHQADVCLVPYVESAWARACNPVKVLEYLAAGKPVVGADLPALRLFGSLVQIATGPQAWVTAVQSVLEHETSTSAGVLRERVRAETWHARAATVLELARDAVVRRQTLTTVGPGPSIRAAALRRQ